MSSEGTGGRGVLVICNGGFEGMEYELTADETIIGRNPTTSITLLDENISREHSVVFADRERNVFTIEDLQSTNGTKVNGKRIRSVELSPRRRDPDRPHPLPIPDPRLSTDPAGAGSATGGPAARRIVRRGIRRRPGATRKSSTVSARGLRAAGSRAPSRDCDLARPMSGCRCSRIVLGQRPMLDQPDDRCPATSWTICASSSIEYSAGIAQIAGLEARRAPS